MPADAAIAGGPPPGSPRRPPPAWPSQQGFERYATQRPRAAGGGRAAKADIGEDVLAQAVEFGNGTLQAPTLGAPGQ